MADWSALPIDLLETIGNHLDTPELLRSVCRSWRSSIPATSSCRGRLRGSSQILPSKGFVKSRSGLYLSERTVYLMGKPCSPHLGSWLMEVEEIGGPRSKKRLMRLLNRIRWGYPVEPSLNTRYSHDPKSLPHNFPRALDARNFKVKELAHEYVLQSCLLKPLQSRGKYTDKVAVMWLDSEEKGESSSEFILLTIHNSGKLATFRSGDSKWNVIREEASPHYDDVIAHEGKLLAVDSEGWLVSVDEQGGDNLALVANPVYGGEKKFLVHWKDELLLVDRYTIIEEVDTDDYCPLGGRDCALCARAHDEFKVYKLDAKEQAWVEVDSLRDGGVLFLGYEASAYAASSSDLYGCGGARARGNCIVFLESFHGQSLGNEGIHVFGLERSGRAAPLKAYPEFNKIFWPPPEWLLAGTAVVPKSTGSQSDPVRFKPATHLDVQCWPGLRVKPGI